MISTTPTLPSARRIVATALALVLLGIAAASEALLGDRDKPINFSGDSGDANMQSRGGTLTGNVIITQGTLEIRADRIVFRQNADNSLSATAYGNPVAFRQKRDGVDEYYEAYAQRIEYDGTHQLLELFDRALLKRGQDEIRSNYVSYNVGTELFKAEGRPGSAPDPAGPGSRVRGMFQPKSSDGLPGKDDGKGAAKAPAKAAARPDGKGEPIAAEPPVELKPAIELAPAPSK